MVQITGDNTHDWRPAIVARIPRTFSKRAILAADNSALTTVS
jgi:hypothetical protein